MKAAILFSTRTFLLNFIIWLFSINLVNFLFNPTFSQDYLLSAPAFLGFFYTVYHVYKHIREVKKLHGGGLASADFKVHQVLYLRSPLKKEQILAKLQTNFPAHECVIASGADTISFKTNSTWKSYGEKVQIRIKELNEESSEIMIESKPINLLTFWDFGKNQENVIYLKNLLTA